MSDASTADIVTEPSTASAIEDQNASADTTASNESEGSSQEPVEPTSEGNSQEDQEEETVELAPTPENLKALNSKIAKLERQAKGFEGNAKRWQQFEGTMRQLPIEAQERVWATLKGQSPVQAPVQEESKPIETKPSFNFNDKTEFLTAISEDPQKAISEFMTHLFQEKILPKFVEQTKKQIEPELAPLKERERQYAIQNSFKELEDYARSYGVEINTADKNNAIMKELASLADNDPMVKKTLMALDAQKVNPFVVLFTQWQAKKASALSKQMDKTNQAKRMAAASPTSVSKSQTNSSPKSSMEAMAIALKSFKEGE